MRLQNLTNGMRVRCRIGKHGEQAPVWEPWAELELYVCRRLADLPKRQRRSNSAWQAGSIITLIPKGVVCAEFGQGDFDNGVFNCEEWLFEIEGLTE